MVTLGYTQSSLKQAYALPKMAFTKYGLHSTFNYENVCSILSGTTKQWLISC